MLKFDVKNRIVKNGSLDFSSKVLSLAPILPHLYYQIKCRKEFQLPNLVKKQTNFLCIWAHRKFKGAFKYLPIHIRRIQIGFWFHFHHDLMIDLWKLNTIEKKIMKYTVAGLVQNEALLVCTHCTEYM